MYSLFCYFLKRKWKVFMIILSLSATLFYHKIIIDLVYFKYEVTDEKDILLFVNDIFYVFNI